MWIDSLSAKRQAFTYRINDPTNVHNLRFTTQTPTYTLQKPGAIATDDCIIHIVYFVDKIAERNAETHD